MKKQKLALDRKLFFEKAIVAQLNPSEKNEVKGGSLTCHTREPMGCPDNTTPGVNECVLTVKPTLIIACPPTPVTVVPERCSLSS